MLATPVGESSIDDNRRSLHSTDNSMRRLQPLTVTAGLATYRPRVGGLRSRRDRAVGFEVLPG